MQEPEKEASEEIEDMTDEAVLIPEHPSEVKEALDTVREMNRPEELERIKKEEMRNEALKKKEHETLMRARKELFEKRGEEKKAEQLVEPFPGSTTEIKAQKKKGFFARLFGKK